MKRFRIRGGEEHGHGAWGMGKHSWQPLDYTRDKEAVTVGGSAQLSLSSASFAFGVMRLRRH